MAALFFYARVISTVLLAHRLAPAPIPARFDFTAQTVPFAPRT